MAKSKSSFWTFPILRELDKLYETMTIRQLESHFGKRAEDIQQAWEFWQAHKRLKISSVKKRKIRITIYRCAWCEGARESADEASLL